MIPDIRKVQSAIEDSIHAEIPLLAKKVGKLAPDQAAETLNKFTAERTTDYTKRYRALGDYLFVKFLDGNIKKEKDGKFERDEYGMPVYPEFPGYDEKYYRSITNDKDGGNRLKSLIIK